MAPAIFNFVVNVPGSLSTNVPCDVCVNVVILRSLS
jgi:hypothetical protein